MTDQVYSKQFNGSGTGELVVKVMNKARTEFALIGYTHAGIDIAPTVFARGTLDDCRKAWKSAVAWMMQYYPNTK